MLNLAYNHQPACGALAWATLLALNETDSVPNLELPEGFKSLWHPKTYGGGSATERLTALGVLPNPANDRIAFTYPDGMERGVLEVHDAMGRLVYAMGLSGHKGMMEWNVRELPNGLYTVRLVLEGSSVANSKFTVSH
ncbi:MAG: T9SS type A sorting domain-containing protein [Flavobacteriales bacterium]|nr:T9SS type A sorting domain-containing protein [Flavobacteriales bacterium]